MEGEDLRFRTPFSMIVSGVSGSGKTSWVLKLLKNYGIIVRDAKEYKKLLWISGTKQPELFKTIKETFDGTCEFLTELPEDLYATLEKRKEPCTVIIDDLMQEVKNDSGMGKVFTKGRSHLHLNVIVLLQNFFPQGSAMRDVAINTRYQVFFKCPRDRRSIRDVAGQVMPSSSKTFMHIFEDATRRTFGYLFCDFTQEMEDDLRFRTNIFPDEFPMFVYVPSKV